MLSAFHTLSNFSHSTVLLDSLPSPFTDKATEAQRRSFTHADKGQSWIQAQIGLVLKPGLLNYYALRFSLPSFVYIGMRQGSLTHSVSGFSFRNCQQEDSLQPMMGQVPRMWKSANY